MTWNPRKNEEVRVPVIGITAIVTAVPDAAHPRTYRVAGSDGRIHDVLGEDCTKLPMTDEQAQAYQRRCLCEAQQDDTIRDRCPIHNRYHPEAKQPHYDRDAFAYDHWREAKQRAANHAKVEEFRREMRYALPALYDPDKVADAFVLFAQKIGKLPTEV